ncbi:hypothetical protein TSUD_276220 [Trifolium subterraneum]|uniref:Uncharacterized protein n=1 Tax=Trifolium subterraneum TaxID=3900 RepID=A0A2Z6NPJ4_TRISU|nr:hypothetical protein TSUD_276220 [Trifolium subterraneum]
MSNLSAEERMAFVLKAREQKQKVVAALVNPLSQLVVDESSPKGSKRKNKEESRRISLSIHNKGGNVVAKVEEEEEEGEGEGETEAIAKEDVPVSTVPPPKYGNSSSFADTSSEDLRKMAMDYHIRGTMLSYFLSARQELKVIEVNNKINMVDENLGFIEKQYAPTKAKLVKDIKDLKTDCEEKIKEATNKEQLASAIKERDEAVLQRDQLSKEKGTLTNKVEGLQVDLGSQYDDGFQFYLEQVKIIFPEVEMAKLGQLDALDKIVDGKLVLFTPPGATFLFSHFF